MPDVNSQLSCEFMPRDFSMNSQRGVNSCAMNSVISHDAHKTSPWGGAEENLVELGLGVRGPERVTGAWGVAARRRAHLST